jgi:hypothetical protein
MIIWKVNDRPAAWGAAGLDDEEGMGEGAVLSCLALLPSEELLSVREEPLPAAAAAANFSAFAFNSSTPNRLLVIHRVTDCDYFTTTYFNTEVFLALGWSMEYEDSRVINGATGQCHCSHRQGWWTSRKSKCIAIRMVEQLKKDCFWEHCTSVSSPRSTWKGIQSERFVEKFCCLCILTIFHTILQ